MDLTIRDWMVIIGVLLILAVLLDAYRRVRRDRRTGIRAAPLNMEEREVGADIKRFKELPNGGGRIVERFDLPGDDQNAESDSPTLQRETVVESEEEGDPEPELELISGMSAAEPENIDWLEQASDPSEIDSLPKAESKKPAKTPPQLPGDVEQEVFTVNVVARESAGFQGEDILHILLACDLRFGDMGFFHRHEQEAGRGSIQFSVANMMQPGVFDIDKMGDFNTAGLVFFLTLPGPQNMTQAYDDMLETAQAVAKNLDGDILDETRSAITKQTLEHARQQIRDLERRMLAQINQ
ncbi:MAG: cell division protein ZipA [Halieaceae bacterium]|jgi:cell division protein ZipA|nr:cell division protein ZipA [Halieaceae bacterium]